ncbi:Tetratricopeptide repeat-containing protein [Tistlia consotensis]|uniref:Tetratricopeptide repeat-containing protein n=1 Tax=Tistlia consotensis USBA 355 TaxID=560819 RepID=A0A1Y6CB50_9PROT|nr:tetratricopeptide repeat protein [Tistlia consotensis]SMF46060.1 Tetratricopeptide repeat-containing protein [Tistlia consotensis USBA 355]SNR78970.1 Tetratricopeptide repeat-containing protein [Tistlia consotensis]
MRWLATLFFVLAMAPLGAAADQNDPRLDDLFKELKEAGDPINALGIQNAIWQLWLETDDAEAETAMQSGIAALDAHDFEGALKIYDRLVERAPAFAEAWNKRATVEYLLGKYQESLADIAKTLALEPRHFGAITGRGLIQHALGDDLSAIKSFEAALKINPNLVSVRQNLEALKAQQKPI